MIWEQYCRNALERVGCISGVSDPCLLNHVDRDISVVVHGDYFTAMGTDADLSQYTSELEKVFK